MDTKQIQEFLSHLDKSRRRLTGEELEILYRLETHPDPLVRSDVAALLVDHYEEKSEEVLLRLSYDDIGLVRTDAVDSLCMGRKDAVLQRLLYLAEKDPEYTVRGYAVHSLYDAFLNRFGDSDNTLKIVRNLLYPLLQREENAWVRTCFHCVLYLSGDSSCLEALLDLLDDDDFYVRGSVLSAFEDILSEDNESVIEDALQDQLSFEEEQSLSDKIEELILMIEQGREERFW